MQQNFATALKLTLGYEGGKVNDPLDPGGRTNQGITQAVFSTWLSSHGSARRDVYTITPDEVSAIYRTNYWDAVHGDELPGGVDLVTFDFAVNSGVARAAIYLQEIVHAAPDGKIGPRTLAAIDHETPDFLVFKLSAMRLGFLKQLSTWGRFGGGWTTRVNGIEQHAITLCKP